MYTDWTHEQIKAYAKSFQQGDAIYIADWESTKDGWCLVNIDNDFIFTEESPYDLSYVKNGKKIGLPEGFSQDLERFYLISTLNNARRKLIKGNKVVWLGENMEDRTFGKAYIVQDNGEIINDIGLPMQIISRYWGVIPKYSAVIGISSHPTTM